MVLFLDRFQEFISSLTAEQKDNVLVELLSNGKGSLDYAKNLVGFGGIPPVAPETSLLGVFVVYVSQWQLRKKISVVENSDVSHHL